LFRTEFFLTTVFSDLLCSTGFVTVVLVMVVLACYLGHLKKFHAMYYTSIHLYSSQETEHKHKVKEKQTNTHSNLGLLQTVSLCKFRCNCKLHIWSIRRM